MPELLLVPESCQLVARALRARGSSPEIELSQCAAVKAPYHSPHSSVEVVRGKVDDEVSSDPVDGKVLEIGSFRVFRVFSHWPICTHSHGSSKRKQVSVGTKSATKCGTKSTPS